MAAGNLLDVQSNDRLQIDAFVENYGKGQKRFLRSEIERLARKVVNQAAYALNANPTGRERAAAALHAVGDLVDAVGRLSDLRPLDVAAEFAPKDEPSRVYVPASQPWTQISDALKRTRSDHDHISPLAPCRARTASARRATPRRCFRYIDQSVRGVDERLS
jgi:hypothetical protein